MDFIIGLAHWCEIHGPSLILCTQVLPPQCGSCFPGSKAQLTRSGSEPSLGSTSTSGNTATSGTTATTSGNATTGTTATTAGAPPTTTTTQPAGITPPPTSHGISNSGSAPLRPTSNRSASTPRLSSPSETPPASPRSPAIVSSAPEQCRNCTMTLPPQFEGNSSTGRRPLRTTETLLVNPGGDPDRPPSSPIGGSAPAFPSVSEIEGMGEELMTHTHTISYLSSRSPSNPARYAAVRQACIRTLSCELAPSQTSPILFGDPHIGYTIAVVFKVTDNKSRGGLRTYALLAMSMNQKALVQQWGVISGVFMNLVLDIQWGVGERIAREKEAEEAALRSSAAGTGAGAGTAGNFGVGAFGAGSLGSRGPESFLRRRNPGDGAEKRSLADLVGKDRFFVDLHSTFVRLLAGLARVYGFGEAEEEESVAETGAMGPQAGALATGVMTQATNTEARKEAAEAAAAEKAADAKLSQQMQAITLGQPTRVITTQSSSQATTPKAENQAPTTTTAAPAYPAPKKTPTRSMTAPSPLPGPIPTPTPACVTATHVITHSVAAAAAPAPAPGAVPNPPVPAPTTTAAAAVASPTITQAPTITPKSPAPATAAIKPQMAKRTDSEATITPSSARTVAATSSAVVSPIPAAATPTPTAATSSSSSSSTAPQKSSTSGTQGSQGPITLPSTTPTTTPTPTQSQNPISPNFTATRPTGVVGY
ncbi:vesicle coat protein [Pyronema omphalodes]|nr:vesicle coat protein [Pyronema omphalodes]